MTIQMEIFKKFRSQLPEEINNDTIWNVISECVERMTHLERDQETLLDDKVKIEIDDEFWEGDIHLYSGEQYGISWIFDKETGELHTS